MFCQLCRNWNCFDRDPQWQYLSEAEAVDVVDRAPFRAVHKHNWVSGEVSDVTMYRISIVQWVEEP